MWRTQSCEESVLLRLDKYSREEIALGVVVRDFVLSTLRAWVDSIEERVVELALYQDRTIGLKDEHMG